LRAVRALIFGDRVFSIFAAETSGVSAATVLRDDWANWHGGGEERY
jgi:hypothetical protein